MFIKNTIFFILLASSLQLVSAQELKTGLDSFSYIVGLNLGRGMKDEGLDKVSYQALIKGIEDALKKDSTYSIAKSDMGKIQQKYIFKVQSGKIKELQEENERWMVENAKKGGVISLDSNRGQMKITKSGSSGVPRLFDTIEYTVVITTDKGKILMDTRGNDLPRRHILGQIGMRQLEEAFQKSSKGAEFEVYLRTDLIPELAASTNSFEDKYGITIFKFKLINVIPAVQGNTK